MPPYNKPAEESQFLKRSDLEKIVRAYSEGRLNRYIDHFTTKPFRQSRPAPPFFADDGAEQLQKFVGDGDGILIPRISLNTVLRNISKKDASRIYPSSIYVAASWLSKQLGSVDDERKLFAVETEIDGINYSFIGGAFVGTTTPHSSNVIYSGENLEI